MTTPISPFQSNLQSSRPKDELIISPGISKLGMQLDDKSAMELAYRVAWQAIGHVKNAPLAGAVILDQKSRYIASAYQNQAGDGACAIENVLRDTRGANLTDATLFTTIEPCLKRGKTQSCIELITDNRIRRTVFASNYPHSRACGQRNQHLENGKMTVEQSIVCDPSFEDLLEFYSWNITEQMPFVGLTVGCTLDGQFVPHGLQQTWINGERALAYSHWLRQLYDAIIVGANTVISDNPKLNVRLKFSRARTPLRIVLDPQARALKYRKLSETHLCTLDGQKTYWLVGEQARNTVPKKMIEEARALGINLEFRNTKKTASGQQFDLRECLRWLKQEKWVSSILLEGGAGVWGSFLNEGLVQKLHLFQAPTLWGPQNGIHWLAQFKANKPLKLYRTSTYSLGSDLLIEGYIKH
jgi:diaminohydroxyphosphoribosylaminopyrimidine deaminase/5-amino-6-(5-phosphoribosylamino)uracil reductase